MRIEFVALILWTAIPSAGGKALVFAQERAPAGPAGQRTIASLTGELTSVNEEGVGSFADCSDDEIRRYVNERLPTADEEQKRKLEQLCDRIGWTPLHRAAYEAPGETLAELLAQGADVDARCECGKTPLHVAAEYENLAALRILVEHGAKLNLQDKRGKTAVQLSLVYEPAADYLLEAGAEIPDIFVAATAGRDDLVEKILERDMSLAQARYAGGKSGKTAMHFAAAKGHVKVVEKLLAGGADVNAVNKQESVLTPLHYAAIYNHSSVAALLLAHGADRTAKDASGRTPLDHARQSGDAETIRILEQP